MISITISTRPRTTTTDTTQRRTPYATTAATATHALTADQATHAASADEATHAQSADEAQHAQKADEATHAQSADEAQHAQSADTAHDLDNWTTADTRYLSRTHDDTASGHITHLGQVTHQAQANYAADLRSTTYQQGTNSFDGTSWQLHQDPTTHTATLTTDHLRIRGTLTAYELIIRQVRALCGSLGITQACGRIRSVDLTSGQYSYHIHLEGDPIHGYGGFQPGDYIRCQRHTTTGIRGYWVQIEATSNGGECLHILRTQFADTIHIGQGQDDYDTCTTPYPHITTDTTTPILADNTAYLLTTDDYATYDTTDEAQPCLPAPGDEIVQYGSATDPTRRTAIYIHTDGDGTPAIDLLQDISAKTFAGTLRMRIGGTLPDGGFGLYVLNGTIISQSADDLTHYALRPDGSFQLGNEAIKYDPTTQHITLGSGVHINWKQVTPPTTTWNDIDQKPTTYPTDWSQVSARPDWLTTWQGQTTAAGATYVAAKSAFFGTRNDDTTYTGILMSADPITLGTNTDARGLLAIHRDQPRVIIDPVRETYQFHGNILAEHGQINGLHVGLSLSGITTITADNFATHFPTTVGSTTTPHYAADYYILNPIIIIQTLPDEQHTHIQLPPHLTPPTITTADQARLFSYAFLGKTLHFINQSPYDITLHSTIGIQSQATYLSGSTTARGTYTIAAGQSASLTAHLNADGQVYWVYEAAANGLPTGTITPILPPSANKSWTTDYNNSGSFIS